MAQDPGFKKRAEARLIANLRAMSPAARQRIFGKTRTGELGQIIGSGTPRKKKAPRRKTT